MSGTANPLDLKRIYQSFDPEAPLPPGDSRYVPIYSQDHHEDPVARLKTSIEWGGYQSVQLFSGYRGSGKTTELFRLKQELEDSGYYVLYSNASDYLNLSEPIAISDLVMILTGAFGEALDREFGGNSFHETWWRRFKDYLNNTSVAVTGATGSIEMDSPAKAVLGGLKTGLDIKAALKEASSFKTKLRELLENRLAELKKEADAMFEEGVKKIKNYQGAKFKGVVFIFDQLEQLRGTASNELEILQSVEKIFASHLPKLQFPHVHSIYSVPPWLKFVLNGAHEVEVLPSYRLWENRPKRAKDQAGYGCLRKMISLRIHPADPTLLFGAEADGKMDRLIEMSGGHFRDLFRLVREVVMQLHTQRGGPPVEAQLVTDAINRVREHYLPISDEDAERLSLVERNRKIGLKTTSAAETATISRLLDLHMILYFSNGEEWYDIHPLLREEVESIVKLRLLQTKEGGHATRRD